MILDPNLIAPLLLPPSPALLPSSVPQAAVLVLLCPGSDPGSAGLVTVLTRRSDELPIHAGQISFPGGRVHAEDCSLEATALREAYEETDLDPALVRLLGRLPRITVSSGYEVTPVVGWLSTKPQLKAAPREVSEIIECPLSLALDPQLYKTDSIMSNNVRREFYYIEFNNYYVWGATARMLLSLAQILTEGQQT